MAPTEEKEVDRMTIVARPLSTLLHSQPTRVCGAIVEDRRAMLLNHDDHPILVSVLTALVYSTDRTLSIAST